MATSPKGGVHFLRVRSVQALIGYLGGRPEDPRVVYTTGINAGKVYPYASKKRGAK